MTLLMLAAATAAGLVLAATGSGSPADQIVVKQGEAAAILHKLEELGHDNELVVEEYNGARLRLSEIEASLELNTDRLRIARETLSTGQKQLEQRIVELYKEEDASTLEVILGAANLQDLIERVDAVERISSEDAEMVDEVRAARREIGERERKLIKARREQKQVVASIAEKRREIQRSEREYLSYYDSVKAEIADLEEEERARQEQLRLEAIRRAAAAEEAARASASVSERRDNEAGAGSRDGDNRDGGVSGVADPVAVAAEAPAPSPPPAAAAAEAPPPAPPPPPPPAEAPAPKYSGVVSIAMQYLGVPYVWGGASPSGFDCSGFTMYVYAQVGVSLPHHAATQYQYGVAVSRDQLQPGDLVFFNGLGHMGMYIGDGQFVHAPHTGDVVKISSLDDSWYAATWVGARRVT